MGKCDRTLPRRQRPKFLQVQRVFPSGAEQPHEHPEIPRLPADRLSVRGPGRGEWVAMRRFQRSKEVLRRIRLGSRR